VIPDPHPKSVQHQNLITSRGSPRAYAYQVSLTSSSAFVTYLADSRTHRHTTYTRVITIPAQPLYRITHVMNKRSSFNVVTLSILFPFICITKECH